MRNITLGLIFAALWASASVATKFGVHHADPLIIANLRFFIAGVLLLSFAYVIGNKDPNSRLPKKSEWKSLLIFSLLNTTLYLGLYVWALKFTAAGIGSLAVATNPLFITVFSSMWLKKNPTILQIGTLTLGLVGIGIASYPLFLSGHTTTQGVILLMTSMIIVSMASVYYASVNWELSNLCINGWQVLIGGFTLMPITLIFADFSQSDFNLTFWKSVLWLSIAVSIIGLVCWFYLLRQDPIKASMWLFLCPIFGFVYAYFLFGEPITFYTIVGTLLVFTGLLLALYPKLKNRFRKH